MFRNRMRQLLENRQFAIGTMVQIPHEILPESLGYAGFDYVIPDVEHTSFSVEQIERLVRAAQSVQMPSLVRVWGVDPYLIAKTLDTGVEGLMFPTVGSAEEANDAVKYTRLAPRGERGVCPETRSGRYWTMPREDYDQMAQETVVCIMIETKEGLENIEDILSVPEIDMVVVGPWDLAYSLGLDPEDSAIAEAQERVIGVAEEKNVAVMQVAYTIEDIGTKLDRHEEHRVFWYRSDNMILAEAFGGIITKCNDLGYRDLAGESG